MAEERDELEPPNVATGRVLAVVAAVFGLLFASVAGSLAFYRGLVHGSVDPHPAALPAPQLETSIAVRATADRGHGPTAEALRPVDDRAGELAPPSPALSAAMQAEAARGATAYDAVRNGG